MNDTEWYGEQAYVPCANQAIRLPAIVQQIQPSIPIPIFVPLQRYADYIQTAAPGREKTLAHFVAIYLEEQQLSFDLPRDFFVELARSGQDILLLLDGLDEVSSDTERRQVVRAIDSLVVAKPWINVMVTCRTIAYTGSSVLRSDFKEIRVAPLEDYHIERLVVKACKTIYEEDAQQRLHYLQLLAGIDDLEQGRRDRLGEQTRRLVTSPLLVRLLLIIYHNHAKLPEQRVELFIEAIDSILKSAHLPDDEVAIQIQDSVGGDWKLHRQLIQFVAFEMHTRGQQQGSQITQDDIRKVLGQRRADPRAVDELLQIADTRGTLLENVDGVYQFINLSVQEYLVARHFAEANEFHQTDKVMAFFNEDLLIDFWWREPILLLAGYLTISQSLESVEFVRFLSRPYSFIKRAPGKATNPDVELTGAVLAANAYLEWHSDKADLGEELAQVLLDNLKMASSIIPLRVEAGDCLARMGEPRFDPELWYFPTEPNLGFVEIPEGNFIMGRDGPDDDFPAHEVHLPGFYIARYPVTVGQFQCYVDSLAPIHQQQLHPQLKDSLSKPANYPIRGLTFHQATAYCRWLRKQFARQKLGNNPISRLLAEMDNGRNRWIISLPSEAQWEKAARGTKEYVYPWGDDANWAKANVSEAKVRSVCAVGCFHNGRSQEYEIEDCIGNVWEWTSSLYERYPYPSDDLSQRERASLKRGGPRVLRGGAFLRSIQDSPVTVRLEHKDPDLRGEAYGFRLAIIPNPD